MGNVKPVRLCIELQLVPVSLAADEPDITDDERVRWQRRRNRRLLCESAGSCDQKDEKGFEHFSRPACRTRKAAKMFAASARMQSQAAERGQSCIIPAEQEHFPGCGENGVARASARIAAS